MTLGRDPADCAAANISAIGNTIRTTPILAQFEIVGQVGNLRPIVNRPAAAVDEHHIEQQSRNQTSGSETLRSWLPFPGRPINNQPQVSNLPHNG
jgi:hypothetical protein